MKKHIDEKGRLFGKLSVIDLAILVIVIVIALGAYVKFMVLEQTAVTIEAATVHYTLEIVSIRDWTIHNIREGDAVFVTGVYVGTVTGTRYEELEVPVAGEGEVWLAYLPGRYVLYVEIEATATVSDGRFLVSRTVPMAVGNSHTGFTTRYAEFSAVVKEIGLYE